MERRNTERYPVAYPMEPALNGLKGPIELLNVSEGGVAFVTEDLIEKGRGLDIRLFMKEKMFLLKIQVTYEKKLQEGLYNIGACFIDPPEEFVTLLKKEVEEIRQEHRERKLDPRNNVSFTKTAREYLGI